MRTRFQILLCFIVMALPWVPYGVQNVHAARIKELITVRGVRENPLVGYGLVVGLAGTGDTQRTLFTNQSIASLLLRMGLRVDPEKLNLTNTAAVMVTANLPPYGSPGEKIDVNVAAMGNSRSLRGGTLLLTPLKGADGEIYAIAQGALTVGGFVVDQIPFARYQRNAPTSGRIPMGAIIERTVPSRFVVDNKIALTLNDPDFTTSERIAVAINTKIGQPVAKANSPGLVMIDLPQDRLEQTVGFLAEIEGIEVKHDHIAKVVVNERTGTVVIGGNVTLSAAAVAHGNLSVMVRTRFGVSQPNPFATGQTIILPETQVDISEGDKAMTALPDASTVEDLVKALNSIGATPQDMIAILQALRASGSLNAIVEVL